MLIHPTLDRLQALGLQGMVKAFTELDKHGDAATPSHAEWLALLLDRETTWRYDKRLSARLRYDKLRHQAAPVDVANSDRSGPGNPMRSGPAFQRKVGPRSDVKRAAIPTRSGPPFQWQAGRVGGGI
jgi:hypothetical protein